MCDNNINDNNSGYFRVDTPFRAYLESVLFPGSAMNIPGGCRQGGPSARENCESRPASPIGAVHSSACVRPDPSGTRAPQHPACPAGSASAADRSPTPQARPCPHVDRGLLGPAERPVGLGSGPLGAARAARFVLGETQIPARGRRMALRSGALVPRAAGRG